MSTDKKPPNIDKQVEIMVAAYNEQMPYAMTVKETDLDYYALWINHYEITTGDIIDMFDRIKGICRENGVEYSW